METKYRLKKAYKTNSFVVVEGVEYTKESWIAVLGDLVKCQFDNPDFFEVVAPEKPNPSGNWKREAPKKSPRNQAEIAVLLDLTYDQAGEWLKDKDKSVYIKEIDELKADNERLKKSLLDYVSQTALMQNIMDRLMKEHTIVISGKAEEIK